MFVFATQLFSGPVAAARCLRSRLHIPRIRTIPHRDPITFAGARAQSRFRVRPGGAGEILVGEQVAVEQPWRLFADTGRNLAITSGRFPGLVSKCTARIHSLFEAR
jgi:hypothetical protein